MKKTRRYFYVLAIALLGLNFTTNVSAASTIEEAARPVYQNIGTTFGSRGYDFTYGGIVANKQGQVGMCHMSYNIDGDFAGLSGNMGGNAGALFTIVNPDGTRLTTIKLTNSSVGTGTCNSVSVDAEGNFYVVGMTTTSGNATAIFGTDVSKGNGDGFVTKIDTNGEFVWYRFVGSAAVDRLNKSVVDKNGDLVITGRTENKSGDGFTGTSNGGSDLWFAKLNTTDGSYKIDPVFIGGSGYEGYNGGSVKMESGLVTDEEGNFYVNFTTDSQISGDITKNSIGQDVGFLKLDNDFNVLKYNRFGGSGVDNETGLIRTFNGTFVMGLISNSVNLPSALYSEYDGSNAAIVEVDEDFNYIGGRVIGGNANDAIAGYTISPSGDIVVLGHTYSTDGDFTANTKGELVGYVLNLDSSNYSVKNSFIYGSLINSIIYPSNQEGKFTLIGETDKPLPVIEIPSKGSSDIFYAVFGPSEVTPAVITAKDYTNVLKGTNDVNVKKSLSAVIGKYTEFLSQSELVANPATIDTTEKKSIKIVLSGSDATPRTSYINVTENANPVVSGLQVIDAPDLLRVVQDTNFTSDSFLKFGRISAWNMDTNNAYTVSVDATELETLNTTTSGVVPVTVSITSEAKAAITKTVQVKVMSKEEIIAEIKEEAEAKWGGDQTEYAETTFIAIAVGILTPNDVINYINTTKDTAEEALANLDASLINVDTDGNGKPDYNIDIDGDGIADINVDTDGDGIPDANTVQDKDENGLNYDANGDGYPDNNIDMDGNGTADLNVDTNGDGKPDVNIDTDGDNNPDVNIDTNGDGNPDVNIDTDGDGKPDVNIDTDGDKNPDINIDTDGNGKPDVNVDIDGDGKPDINIDTDGNGKPDINIDTDGNGKPDVNVDIDGDGKPDVNIDTDGDGKADTNIDENNNGILDSLEGNLETDENIDGNNAVDGSEETDLENINGNNQLPITGNATVGTMLTLLGLSVLLFARRYRANI